MIQIFTGEGKGKTTAAIGQVVRAIGHGQEVFWIYFHKNPAEGDFGELKILRELEVEIKGFAQKHPEFYERSTEKQMRKECLNALEFIKGLFEKNVHDLIVLDEMNISLRDGFLEEEEILELLDRKPEGMNVILTGRGATEKLMERGDLVSEIKKIKHPRDTGTEGWKGIDY